MQNSFLSIVRCGLSALPLALLCGCNDCDVRAYRESVDARLTTPPQKTKDNPPPPLVNATPIRRTLAGMNSTVQDLARLQLQLQVVPMSFFAARKLNDGRIELRAADAFASSAKAADWLKKHGFAKAAADGWSRRLTAAQLTQFKRAMQGAVAENNAAWSKLLTPGNDAPLKLVFTGQPLDITAAQPSTYIEARRTGSDQAILLRSGRFFVAENGELRMASAASQGNDGGYAPSGIEKPLPRNADRMSVESGGRVLAFDLQGTQSELGRLKIVSAPGAVPADEPGTYRAAANNTPENVDKPGELLLTPGHLELRESLPDAAMLRDSLVLSRMYYALEQSVATTENLLTTPESDVLPLIVHAALPKTVEHLKSLKIPVEKNNERTTIGTDAEEEAVTEALVKVMTGLRRRMEVHEENLRNAGKTRDADGRLNAYRRKTVQIGAKGELIEGMDNTALPKTYKPGDPDAGADGFVIMPNVNKAVETAEFKAVIEEYKLLRISLERLAPSHIFPEPPPVPPVP